MKVNTIMLIEAIRAQAVGESVSKIVKGKTIEDIKEIYGAYGFSMENWKDIKDNDLKLGDKTQLTLFTLSGILSCINDDCIIYNQSKINNALKYWYNIRINKSNVNILDKKNSEKSLEENLLISKYKKLIENIPTDPIILNNIEAGIKENKVFDLNNQARDSSGLMALSRVLPFPFFAKSDLEAWVFGAQQATLTHGGDKTWQSCAVLSLFIFKILKEHKRIKTKWKQIVGDKETFDKYYQKSIDLERIMRSTISVTSNFKNTEEIIQKLNFTAQKVKESRSYKDIFVDYTLHEAFGEQNNVEDILCAALYIACVTKNFELALEVALNNNFDTGVITSVVAPIFVIYHRGASLDYMFNEIKENKEIEDYLYEIRRMINDKNFRMLTKDDVSKEELNIFIQMRSCEKRAFEPIVKPTFWEKVKKIVRL